jgi:hypothetical protein
MTCIFSESLLASQAALKSRAAAKPARGSPASLRARLAPTVNKWARAFILAVVDDNRSNGVATRSADEPLRGLFATVRQWMDEEGVSSSRKKALKSDGPQQLDAEAKKACSSGEGDKCGPNEDYTTDMTLFRQVMQRVHLLVAERLASKNPRPDRDYRGSKRFQDFYGELSQVYPKLVRWQKPERPPVVSDPLAPLERLADKSLCSISATFNLGQIDLWNRIKASVGTARVETCEHALLNLVCLVLTAVEAFQSLFGQNECPFTFEQRLPRAFFIWNRLRVSEAMLCFLARAAGSPSDMPHCSQLARFRAPQTIKKGDKEERVPGIVPNLESHYDDSKPVVGGGVGGGECASGWRAAFAARFG